MPPRVIQMAPLGQEKTWPRASAAGPFLSAARSLLRRQFQNSSLDLLGLDFLDDADIEACGEISSLGRPAVAHAMMTVGTPTP
jgi:hypothetical protein